MNGDGTSRRRFLGGLATAVTSAVAGCAAPSARVGSRATDVPGGPADDSAAGGEASTPVGTAEAGSVYTRVYREAIDSVALISTLGPAGPGQGSGFVFDRRHVLTNQHVVADASTIDVRFSRGEWRTGSVAGGDVYSDLAVVRVDDPPAYASPLPLVESDPAIGREVVALGSPFGLEKSLSVGVVSGTDRTLPTRGGFTIPDAIQTDAAVNPGNSGGPLVTLDGRVVGVIRSGGGENIGFAISAALIGRVAPALIDSGEYRHSYMGVSLTDVTPTIAAANELAAPRGVLVVRVLPDSPSADVLRGSPDRKSIKGIQVPVGGDVILGLGDETITTTGELSRYLALRTRPGDTIPVTVRRDGERRTVDLTLGTRPPPTQR